MDAAACIGCGACVAACPNGAAQLYTSAKLAHLNLLPQGQAERWRRTEDMVETMESFFGSCTNYGECQEACPKEIPIDFIALMNRDFLKSKLKNRKLVGQHFPDPLTNLRTADPHGAALRRNGQVGSESPTLSPSVASAARAASLALRRCRQISMPTGTSENKTITTMTTSRLSPMPGKVRPSQ